MPQQPAIRSNTSLNVAGKVHFFDDINTYTSGLGVKQITFYNVGRPILSVEGFK